MSDRYDSNGDERKPDPSKPFRKWTLIELDNLREELRRMISPVQMKALAVVLIGPYLRGGNANILIENRIPRGREYTDTLYLVEMMKVWQERDGDANAIKLFEAMHTVDSNMEEDAWKHVLGMELTPFQSTS